MVNNNNINIKWYNKVTRSQILVTYVQCGNSCLAFDALNRDCNEKLSHFNWLHHLSLSILDLFCCRVKENEELWRSSVEAAVTTKEEKTRRLQTEKQLVVDQVHTNYEAGQRGKIRPQT